MRDLKCLLGMHKYQLLETREIKDTRGDLIKVIYVTQCMYCGKIKREEINCAI